MSVETKNIDTRSATLCVTNGRAHVSLCSKSGEHYSIKIDRLTGALLLEQLAAYLAGTLRKLAK